MAYTGKIDEQNPDQMFPASEQPGFFGAVKKGIEMDFPKAFNPDLVAATKAKWDPQVVANINSGNYNTAPPAMPQTKNPGDVLPPIPAKTTGSGRNYLAEVEASDRKFNAERDTVGPTPAQAAWSPPAPQPTSAPVNTRDAKPGLGVMSELRKLSAGDSTMAGPAQTALVQYEKELAAQVHAMLPGASPKEIRSVMATIGQATRNPNAMNPSQPAANQPITTVQQAVDKASQPAANYQKLGAGQSIYQMMPDGTAKLVTTAPGGAAEQHKGDQFKDLQKNSMHEWDRIKKEYDKAWDKITENVTDPVAKEQALRSLNTQHFKSLGVPDELAEIPVSFKSFATEHMQRTGRKVLTAEDRAQLELDHKRAVQLRNRLLESRFNSTLSFR